MAKRFTDGYFDWVWHYYGKYDDEDFVRYSHLMQYKEFTLAQQLRWYINWTIDHGWPNHTHSVY